MAEPQQEQRQQHRQREILRGYELRLLRCTVAPPPSGSPSESQSAASPPSECENHLHAVIDSVLNSIETGNYLQALSTAAGRIVHVDAPPDSDSADRFYTQVLLCVESFLQEDSVDVEKSACRVILVVCLAVSAFFCFTQSNIIGPLVEFPKCPLPFKVSTGGEFVAWENWAHGQLMLDGSHLLGKVANVQYLVFAKMLVMRTKDLLFEGSISSPYGIKSISWWFARLLLVQQQILDELCSSLFDLLQVCMIETLHHFGTLKQVKGYWSANLHDEEAAVIVSTVHLEAGVMEYIYGRVDSCRHHLESAEVAAGIQFSVTGVLGCRTLYQHTPKAQRILVASERSSNDDDDGIRTCNSTSPKVNIDPCQHGTSDVLMTPKFIGSGDECGIRLQGNQNAYPVGVAPLNTIQQAVALAHCLLIEKSHRDDELQRWDMAPYIEAIDSQHSSLFILRFLNNLLRIRWESSRSRTKERALEMMGKLVEGIRNPLPAVVQRIPFCYMVYIPTIPALQKEYAELLVSCGLVGEAITIYESLELWDNLIYCNCLLGKKAAAVELIKMRLSEMPHDPRLWCSLGDVTNNDSCYEKALEVSNNKSARAKRSLARSAYNRGDYETSKILWESAMTLNSLYSDGWFAFGAAALKARDVDKALEAFSQAVKLDPDNGEAWNNIACLHMIKKRSKESFIAFKEALKFKRESWQLWENFGQVAMDVGNVQQALEAVKMVLQLSNSKRIDIALLERIMQEMEARASSRDFICLAGTQDRSSSCLDDSHNGSVDESQSKGERPRETEQLIELLGKILQQIVKIESRADVWGLYARWHKMRGDLAMCSEALLKQVRSYQGSDLWNDRERFTKFAHASLELCKVYLEISSSTGSRRELSAAEMHLRNVVKQAERFSGTEEFKNLQAFHDEVKMRLQSNSLPT